MSLDPPSQAGSGFIQQSLRLLTLRGRPPSRSSGIYPALSQLEAKIRGRPGPDELSAILDRSKTALLHCLEGAFETSAAKAIVIKVINLCLAKNHFLARDAVILSRPLALVFDPSNSCNLACPGCVHSANSKDGHWFDWKPGLLGATRLGAFLDLYGPSAISATLFNYGEPLVNPQTPKFIRLAKESLLRTLLSTNLSLPRFDPEPYVESGLDQMILSIDGATQAVYERFRRKGNIELVLDNVRKLVDAKRRSGRLTPVLTWRFLAFQHNVHEIPAAMDLAHRMGVDQFKAGPAWEVDWDDPDIRPAQMHPFEREFEFKVFDAIAENCNPFPESLNVVAIEREFAALGVAGHLASFQTQPSGGPTCEWLYKNITMDAGGRIFPCCCSPRPGEEMTFATIDPATATDVFQSGMFQQARQFFSGPAAYRSAADPDARQPYCLKCSWSKTSAPNRVHMRNYFAALGPDVFDKSSLGLLSSW